MQILAEAEDLPTTANIKTQLISLWTVPIFGVVLLIAFRGVPGFLPTDVAGPDRRSGRGVLLGQHRDDPVLHDHLQSLRRSCCCRSSW